MKGIWKLWKLFVIAGILMLCSPTVSYAKPVNITCATLKNRKKAPKLKAGKTYTVIQKGTVKDGDQYRENLGYVMFVAKATKTYTFSFSNFRSTGASKKKDFAILNVTPLNESCFTKKNKSEYYYEWDAAKFKTKDGYGIDIGTKRAAKSLKKSGDPYYPRTGNTAKFKMKKGDVYWLQFSAYGYSETSKKGFRCKLKIK